MNTTNATRIFTTLIVITILFHLALAAGAPWGELAWGGAFPGRLPPPMRVASIGAVTLLGLFALVVFIRAGKCLPSWQSLSRKLIWIVVVYSVFGIVGNSLSPSVWEGIIWVPVTVILAISSFTVARAR